ncbi:hypothetical protein AJ80_08227 [Polytolypa hystricis UAMH7299]|uniref:Uncharacterized protein n=1 Tax=Polytolypa hystricis (strain UAMH7299) TaxID=1447883 RepID=A0A2B7XAZ0_POLH7|nr:hypothetical protein AJ80_08227 [Polytolypa hystricis UAMH7299]
MGPLLYDNYSDGPAIVLSPQPHHHYGQFSPRNASTIPPSVSHPRNTLSPFPMDGVRSGSPMSFASYSTSWTPASSSGPVFTNPSRKRSRDDYSLANEYANGESNSLTSSAGSIPTHPARDAGVDEQPIYGEGMVLLNPRTGIALSAESQTGTWFEEKAEAATSSARPLAVSTGASERPDLPSRKSQRLDATASNFDDITLAAIQSKLGSSTHDNAHRSTATSSLTPSPSSSGPEEPRIDDCTLLLGISWQRISSTDNDMASAIRGWERYIDNHFSRYLQGATILLKHRGLNAYLVTARPTESLLPSIPLKSHPLSLDNDQSAFYLFNEDLTEARLVSSTWDACVQNLRSAPIAYEPGSEVLKAAERTPERAVEDKGVLIGSVHGNTDMGMDIDM